MEFLVPVIVLIFVLVAVFIKHRFPAAEDAGYDLRGGLFTPAERAFYGVLQQAASGDRQVFGKVRVADVLAPRKGRKRGAWQRSFNRISAKHFDYVICDAGDLSVLAAVELHDRSHHSSKRKDRDAFLRAACADAGLTFHEFQARTAYSVTEVREVVFPEHPANRHRVETRMQERQTDNAEPSTPSGPRCPDCHSDLIVKVATRGARKGTRFLACSGFPSCRYIDKAAV